MKKALTYIAFAFASIVVIAGFVTATNYLQLGIAVVLYPLLVYFAFKLFPRAGAKSPAILIQIPSKGRQKVENPVREKVDIADIDKRTFLKLIGATGISFFLISLFGRRAESFLFDRSFGLGVAPSGTNNSGSLDNNQAGGQLTDGYKISEIDEGTVSYYGFINQEGSWLIMREDTVESTYRYAKGASNFGANWKSREDLKYEYYHELF